jgi:hypothetical protein
LVVADIELNLGLPLHTGMTHIACSEHTIHQWVHTRV